MYAQQFETIVRLLTEIRDRLPEPGSQQQNRDYGVGPDREVCECDGAGRHVRGPNCTDKTQKSHYDVPACGDREHRHTGPCEVYATQHKSDSGAPVPASAVRKHEDLCQQNMCFEDDFTPECKCWCHKSDPDAQHQHRASCHGAIGELLCGHQ